MEYYLREFVEGLNDLNQAGGTDTPFSVGNKSFKLSEVRSTHATASYVILTSMSMGCSIASSSFSCVVCGVY